MNVFQLIKEVLDDSYNQINAESDEEKVKLIRFGSCPSQRKI